MASKETSSEMLPTPKSGTPKSETDDICWQSALKSPTDRLAALYEHSRFTDLNITFPGHSTTLKVHRLVLAMSSPVFERMLFGPMAEGEELQLPEDPPEAFKWLMQYVYSGSSNFPSVHIAVQVLHLASKYQMQALFSLCSQFLQNNVNGSNLPLVYDTASLLGDEVLQNTCSEVLSVAAEVVFMSPEIGQLSGESMKHLLQQDLNIKSEVSVFKGLVKWGSTQSHQSSDAAVVSSCVRQKIEEFLPHVRFLTMGLDEFVEDVLSTNILTPEEGIAIMMNIKNVKNIPLPEICSKITERRLVFTSANLHQVILCNQSVFSRGIMHNANFPNSNRQKLIANFKVSKDIYLSCITITTLQGSLIQNWHIEVTDHSGDVLGEVKCGESNQGHSRHIIASFSTPVLLRLGKLYDVWVRGFPSVNESISISKQYGNLNFSGCIHLSCYTDIRFWCPGIPCN